MTRGEGRVNFKIGGKCPIGKDRDPLSTVWSILWEV